MSNSQEGLTIERGLEPVIAHKNCPECHSKMSFQFHRAHKMNSCWKSSPPQFLHKCSSCAYEGYLPEKYPCVKYAYKDGTLL